MKKNILFLFIMLVFSSSFVSASDKMHVCALEQFDTTSPAKTIDVSLLEDTVIGENEFKANDIIHCEVIKVTDPKRGKRSASFSVKLVSYSSGGVEEPVKGIYCGNYAKKVISKEELKNVDATKVGKKAAITVGNHFVKGVAPIASMAEGMVKDKNGHPIESGVKQVYKDSPLSYVEKGSELVITPGENFYLIFK